jgi:hypothetical protein
VATLVAVSDGIGEGVGDAAGSACTGVPVGARETAANVAVAKGTPVRLTGVAGRGVSVGAVSLPASLSLANDGGGSWLAVGEGGRIGSVAVGSTGAAGSVPSRDGGRICPTSATPSPAIKKNRTKPAIHRTAFAEVISERDATQSVGGSRWQYPHR